MFIRLQCQVLPALVIEGCVWYFRSLHPAFEMSYDTEYLYKILSFFEQITNFPSRHLIRFKNDFWSSARLVSFVLTQ